LEKGMKFGDPRCDFEGGKVCWKVWGIVCGPWIVWKMTLIAKSSEKVKAMR
jgi:hypothetical protein